MGGEKVMLEDPLTVLWRQHPFSSLRSGRRSPDPRLLHLLTRGRSAGIRSGRSLDDVAGFAVRTVFQRIGISEVHHRELHFFCGLDFAVTVLP